MFQVGFQGGRHTSHTAGGGAGGAGAAHAADVKLQALGCFQVTMKPHERGLLRSNTTVLCGGLSSGAAASHSIWYVTVWLPPHMGPPRMVILRPSPAAAAVTVGAAVAFSEPSPVQIPPLYFANGSDVGPPMQTLSLPPLATLPQGLVIRYET